MAQKKHTGAEDIVKRLIQKLNELERETAHPDWAERASDILQKVKTLGVEAVALASLLLAGKHILTEESGHPEPVTVVPPTGVFVTRKEEFFVSKEKLYPAVLVVLTEETANELERVAADRRITFEHLVKWSLGLARLVCDEATSGHEIMIVNKLGQSIKKLILPD